MDHKWYPENDDVKIHSDKKSFFSAENKFEQHHTEYQTVWITLSVFFKYSFLNHFYVHSEIFQVDVIITS